MSARHVPVAVEQVNGGHVGRCQCGFRTIARNETAKARAALKAHVARFNHEEAPAEEPNNGV